MKSWMRVVIEDATFDKPWGTGVVESGLNRLIDLVESSDVHAFRTQALEDLADHIAECDDEATLSRLMLQTAHETGFQNYTLFVIRQGTSGPFRTRVSTSYNSGWVARYQEASYQFVDPVVAEAGRREGWFEFSDLEACAPAIQEFWNDAEQHRIGRNGICMASTRPDGSRIGLSFSTQNTAEKTGEFFRLNGYDLDFIAESAISTFCTLSLGQEKLEDTLTVEELRFLYVLATSETPADALKITATYGSNPALQASIRQKLGVQSAFQAIAYVTARGLFDRLPYDVAEVSSPFPKLEGLDIVTADQPEKTGSDG